MQQDNITTFDSLMEHYSTWIIEYSSPNLKQSLFLIWYTDSDKNETDRLLSYKTGEIFAVQSLKNIKEILSSKEKELTHFDNLSPWLYRFNDFEITASTSYNLDTSIKNISHNIFDIPTTESITHFINLFNDFALQDIRNNYLQEFSEHELIQEAWEYFYDYIFWPKFNDKEKLKNWDGPPLIINHKEFLTAFKILLTKFEERILVHYS